MNPFFAFPVQACAARTAASVLLALFLTASCENDDDSKTDYGSNDPDRVVCLGDSITAGYGNNGASYPARLAGMAGKTVINAGVSGQEAPQGASRLRAQLQGKPGTVCILYGANDAIRGRSPASVKESLRTMIRDCQANQTVVIVATLTPMIGQHEAFADDAKRISQEIRAVAREEGSRLLDLEKQFGRNPALFDSDGLHMSDSGNQRLAELFRGKL